MTNSWSLLYDELYDMNLTDKEVQELRSKKQELTQYGKEKIRELMMHEDIPWTQYSKDDAERMKSPEQNPDEIVLEDVKMFHLESMNERNLWVGVYTQDGKIYHLNISAVGDKLSYWWSDETCD